MSDGRKPTGKHPEKRLSPAFVRKATKPGRYYDGNGLFLKVDPSDAKRCRHPSGTTVATGGANGLSHGRKGAGRVAAAQRAGGGESRE